MAEIGLDFLPGDVVYIKDLSQVEGGYIHHTRAPVAAIGYALAQPLLSRGRFPRMTLEQAIVNIPSLDSHEVSAIARITGAGAIEPTYHNAEQFTAALLGVIDLYHLDRFFHLDCPSHRPKTHYAVRPCGYGVNAREEIPAEMKAWRSSFRKLDLPRRMLVATIVWLYQARVDTPWLKGIPHAWHISDSVVALREASMLKDWGKMVATYPGW